MVRVTKIRQEKYLFLFLIVWAAINILQATFMDLHSDEAYYWMYSKFLDWGYFDHPPMVALFIKAGDLLAHSAFTLRLVTIITTSISIFLLWKILSPYGKDIRLFILLFSSIVIFHVYGFITTPDSPLLFFTVLFFYIYQKYALKDSYVLAILLAVVTACMLYSKYHAVLIIFFTLISNLKLLRRPSLWLTILLTAVALVPHIWWQIQNHYPSFYYHIIDRSADAYQLEFTYQYLLAQIALAGPLIGWYLYGIASRQKVVDPFTKAMKFNFFGIFLFFLLSSFKGRVEAHWTLPGMLCLFCLSYIYFISKGVPNWFNKVAQINIALIVMVRLVLIIPIPFLERVNLVADYFNTENWAKKIHNKAKSEKVIFLDSFQLPSKYNYYNNTTAGFGYDSRMYRKNQFDIWPLEDSLRNHRVYYVLQHNEGVKGQDTITTEKGVFYGRWIDKARIYQKVGIELQQPIQNVKPGQLVELLLNISNPYNEPIYLGNVNEVWKCFLEYGFKKQGKFIGSLEQIKEDLNSVRVNAKNSTGLKCKVKMPNLPGNYKLVFSIRTEPFFGSRNSSHINVNVVP
ncbi:MAG: glycosyltransferase family 39 protein [Bacteroidota bacterium]